MSSDEPSIMKLGESRVGFGPYRMPAIIAIKRDGGVILNDSCKQPLGTGELVTEIFTEDYTISVGPDYQVYIFANNEHEKQGVSPPAAWDVGAEDRTAVWKWRKRADGLAEIISESSMTKKKSSNILKNLFWLGVAAAILAAIML